ncbi:MAG: uroporphyrinogen-III C-methyltransferase [Clostridium sp.]|uniref:uroporphyrinogen-III C-methyltransferase n=1 Tax=Clostridium sp. TaxID=1506 RepID=UPI003F379E9C
MAGKAYLIGAGPLDEELLTLKGKRVLEKCTAVVYDRLVSTNVLNFLNETCETYYCGKKPNAHSMKQEEINELLVKLVKEGHIVGRIKGGDPYVFGRGGEEALALLEEGLEFEVVPGVTSPVSVLNYAGIPITHRGIAQSFHIVTGMSAKNLNVNFEALAKENGTLVFMMGLENIDIITSELIKYGKDKNTKSAIVMKGTSSKQKKVIGTLENIGVLAKENNLESPCIIVVGDVVSLSDKLDWFIKKPLFSKNICITRSKEQSSNLKNNLKDLGAYVTEINSIKVKSMSENLESYLDILEGYNHILFTSVNGVNEFFEYLIEKEYDIRNIRGDFYAVGKATKKALLKRGIIPKKTAKTFVAEGLFEEVKDLISKDDRVLIPTSLKARNFLEERIKGLGAVVDRVNIYDTIRGNLFDDRAFEDVDYVLYTSPTTVFNMIELFGLEKLKMKKAIAIGPKTREALEENNIESLMCKTHSEEGFLKEIVNLI